MGCVQPDGFAMTYAMPANDGQTSAWPQPVDETAAASDGFASLVLRLRLALRRDPDPRKRQLVEQILTAAAEREQRLAEQADRIAELEQLSGSDDLTGLPNRQIGRASCRDTGVQYVWTSWVAVYLTKKKK